MSLTSLAMIGWIPTILLLFALMTPRRAVIVAYIVGWMYLPVISWDLPGLPAYDKLTATNLGILASILLFDLKTLLRFRPAAIDIPVVVFCLCPILSSLSNDLGLYDGLAGAWRQVVTWSVPWVVGRCYLGSLRALQELAMGMLIASTVYIPLCVYEMLFGANLHFRVYNYYQHGIEQTIRTDGSIRPMVFMQHGLVLSMWLASSALIGLAIVYNRNSSSVPVWTRRAMFLGVVATCLLSRSLGAIMLMSLGMALWVSVRILHVTVPILLVVACVPGYMALRATQLLTNENLSDAMTFSLESVGASPAEIAARTASATTRFYAEDRLCSEAQQQPLFGANSWTFHQYTDPETGDLRVFILDGRWAILFATRGLVGLAAWTAMVLMPMILFLWRFPASQWRNPLVAIGGALSIVLVMHACDSLLNSDPTPLYTCIAGGVAGVSRYQVLRRRDGHYIVRNGTKRIPSAGPS